MIYEQRFVTKKALKNVLFRVNSSVFRKGRVLEHRRQMSNLKSINEKASVKYI